MGSACHKDGNALSIVNGRFQIESRRKETTQKNHKKDSLLGKITNIKYINGKCSFTFEIIKSTDYNKSTTDNGFFQEIQANPSSTKRPSNLKERESTMNNVYPEKFDNIHDANNLKEKLSSINKILPENQYEFKISWVQTQVIEDTKALVEASFRGRDESHNKSDNTSHDISNEKSDEEIKFASSKCKEEEIKITEISSNKGKLDTSHGTDTSNNKKNISFASEVNSYIVKRNKSFILGENESKLDDSSILDSSVYIDH